MATYQELIAQREALTRQQAEIDKAIEAQSQVHRQEGVEKVKALMAEYGLTTEDLTVTTKATRGKAKAASGDERRKVAAKYRDAATGASWSGRGLKPKWLAAALADGKTLADFAV